MIDFDLPTVEIDLQEGTGRGGHRGGQQIGRFAIVEAAAFAFAVRSRSNHEQTHRTSARSSLPMNSGEVFVTNYAPITAIKDPGLFPGQSIILTHLFGSELDLVVEAAASGRCTEAERCVPASAGQHFRSFNRGTKDSAVAETAVGCEHENL